MRQASNPSGRKQAKGRIRKPRQTGLGVSLEELHELEEKAMQLEKLAKTLLNTPQQAFYVYDHAQKQFVLGRKHIHGIFGYKPDMFEKRRGAWAGIIHPDDLDEFQATRIRLLNSPSDEVQAMQVRVRRNKGDHEWVKVHMRVFERDRQGKVLSEAGMVSIITPLMKMEKTLRETEARCNNLFQHNTAGVIAFDNKLHIVDANPATCRMLGYERKALLRLSVLDLAAPGARSGMHMLLRGMLKGCKVSPGMDSTLEDRFGKRVEVMVVPTCFYNDDGRFAQGTLILTDITERKATEAALKRESELSRILIDNAPIAIGLLSATGNILRMNAPAEKLFGYKLSEVKGRELWTLPIMGKEAAKASRQRFQALREGAGRVSATIPMRTRNGETRYVETSTTTVNKPDGNIDFFVTTGTDITERRKLETEVIRVAEQEHIRIGHDLHDGVGQTLTGIASLMEALENSLGGTAKQDAHRIRELIDAAVSETRRLSHGLSPAGVKNRGLAGGLMLIAETVRGNFRRECICKIEEPPPSADQESEIHLFRIAQEAVNNAIRHGGARRIRIVLRRQSTNRGILEISDNGRGFQASKSEADGIGLRVMEHRAHLIGGELHIHGQKGKGVRVSCQFPLHHA
ncbi:MAG: PAS domain S-box protein [Verrucomicrobiaceae bacterium]